MAEKVSALDLLREKGIVDKYGMIRERDARELIQTFKKRKVPPPSPRDLLGSADVCAMVGNISRMTLHRYIDDPVLRFPKPDAVIERRRFWRRATVERWLDEQEAATEAAPPLAGPSRDTGKKRDKPRRRLVRREQRRAARRRAAAVEARPPTLADA